MSTKTTNSLSLPAGSYSFFEALAQDAGNWGGTPLLGGNVGAGRSTPGYIKRLTEAGLINTATDEGDTFVYFTAAGIEAALSAFGIDLSIYNSPRFAEAPAAAEEAPATEAAADGFVPAPAHPIGTDAAANRRKARAAKPAAAKAPAAKAPAAKPAAAKAKAAKAPAGPSLKPATAKTANPAKLAIHSGPAAWLGGTGEVLPMSASAYPELAEGELRCLGACGELKPAGRFPYTGNKGDGKGRYLECGACQTARLAANKAAKAAGQPALPRPRATTIAPSA